MGQFLRESPWWGKTSVSHIDGDSDLAPSFAYRLGRLGGDLRKGTGVPASWLCEGKDQQRNNISCQPFCPQESCPCSPCSEARQFNFFPYVPGIFPAAVFASKSMHLPFKRTSVSTAAFRLTQTESLLIYTASCCVDSSSGTGALSWGVRCEARTAHSSEGTSVAKISLVILNHHSWV